MGETRYDVDAMDPWLRGAVIDWALAKGVVDSREKTLGLRDEIERLRSHAIQQVSPMHLFGPDRSQPGWERFEWSVWVSGPDDILPQPDLVTALAVAHEMNANFGQWAVNNPSPHNPIMFAVVLERGYAWCRPRCAEGHVCCTSTEVHAHPLSPSDCTTCESAVFALAAGVSTEEHDVSELWSGQATDEDFGFHLGEVVLENVHTPDQCAGEPCVLHNPSDHHMRDWPTVWRGDKRIMERTCPHGVGHPDPDDMTFHRRNGRGALGVHGCDGCCSVAAGISTEETKRDE